MHAKGARVNLQDHINEEWWYIPIILEQRRYRQEDQRSKVILGYIVSLRPVKTMKS